MVSYLEKKNMSCPLRAFFFECVHMKDLFNRAVLQMLQYMAILPFGIRRTVSGCKVLVNNQQDFKRSFFQRCILRKSFFYIFFSIFRKIIHGVYGRTSKNGGSDARQNKQHLGIIT